MELARMQDIGGLRAVVSTLKQLEALHKNYKEVLFQHELVSERDYLSKPKQSGYRSIHLVYRYKNAAAPNYDGAEVLHQLVTGSTYQHLPFIQYWVLAAFAEAASLCDGNVAIGLLQQELISTDQLRAAFTRVRLPDVPEIQELFVAAQPKVLTLVSGR